MARGRFRHNLAVNLQWVRIPLPENARPAMPPFVLIALGALGGAALLRWALKEAQRINHELEEARLARVREPTRDEQIRTLRRDPVTGVYRPD